MGSGSKIMILATVIIVAFILQIALIGADRNETPGTVAVAFSKAYFNLDADMADLICSFPTRGRSSGAICLAPSIQSAIKRSMSSAWQAAAHSFHTL